MLMGEFSLVKSRRNDAWLWTLPFYLKPSENSKRATIQYNCSSILFGELIFFLHESKECVPCLFAIPAISLDIVCTSKYFFLPHSVKTRHSSCLNNSESDVIPCSQKSKRRVNNPTGNPIFSIKKIRGHLVLRHVHGIPIQKHSLHRRFSESNINNLTSKCDVSIILIKNCCVVFYFPSFDWRWWDDVVLLIDNCC